MWPDSFTAGARGVPPVKRTFEIPDVVKESNVAIFAHDTKIS